MRSGAHRAPRGARLRHGFTLFELILAIALSAALLALVGTAINLYLMRVDASRSQVEEAQLARSILATIAADIRATTVYQTQDISSVAQLASRMASFDVDDIDAEGEFGGAGGGVGGGGNGGNDGGGGGGFGIGTSTGGGFGASIAGGLSGAAGAASTGGDALSGGATMMPGLNGTLNELYLDVNRLPRLDELFAAAPPASGTPAVAATGPRPSDAKTIRYFVRQGATVEASDPAATLLDPAAQARVGGLVRQAVDQAVRSAAEKTGDTARLESGQVLLAPEVTAVEFRYFDGATAVTEWNMQQMGVLPPAVEVRIWMAAIDAAGSAGTPTSAGVAMPGTRMYSQTIELPLATAANSGSATGIVGSSTGGGASGSSSSSGTGGTL